MSDWLISKKNRYWGLAFPIFECKECGNFEIIGSKEELEKRAIEGWDKFAGHTPHKPYIDEIKIKCAKCGQLVSRIDDVGNVWLDAGSVPFSTYVDPKTKKLSYTSDKKYWQEWFPAEFITESFPGQFKNWFYSMIAMSTVLEKTNPFKMVLGYASMLGEDGRPMHKSWGNSVDFNEGADKIGVDVMRWMFVTHNPEQNLLFGYKKADETRRKFHLILWNVYNFFLTYANTDGWKPISNQKSVISNQVLDRWILSRLNKTVEITTKSLEKYNAQKASEEIENFVNDLSLWYVRRSRDRIGPSSEDENDKNACYETLYAVLATLSKLLAPFMPFLAEEMFTNLTGGESVHLVDWPESSKNLIDSKLELDMEYVRRVVEAGHSVRKKNNLKVRQPLSKLWFAGFISVEKKRWGEYEKLLKDELNVKEIDYSYANEIMKDKSNVEIYSAKNPYFTGVFLNVALDEKLLNEGLARDIVRQIQEERKSLKTKVNEKVNVSIPYWPQEHADYIKKKAMVEKLSKGNFSVKSNE